ncbi:MAG TPA: HlyC/CorC family transporter [Gammaproteobacteria bacterium]|nr:HlyC/CorC family transporter [Gammaproteobacteria bacterium]
MSHIHLLIIALIALILISGFFSGSETAMMAINRYRLRHLLRKNHKAAKRVSQLLERPDRLLGVILIGNTFANMLVSAVATVIAITLFGKVAVVPATIIVALLVLIFAEITPKTLAALQPERFAFPASFILRLLLKLTYPVVWVASSISNNFLKLFKVNIRKKTTDDLTGEEIRTLVFESAGQLAMGSKHMMLGVLDLSAITVDDIKVQRNDIVGINLNDPWSAILQQLSTSQHTRLPVFREDINNVQGILHLRKALNLAALGQLDEEKLLSILEEVYFIPEGTLLNVQLVNFKLQKRRMGLVVDEYGDIQGLLTLDDILEEIVGEFTTNLPGSQKHIKQLRDGSFLVDGGMSIRSLNREMHWVLPITGPKTLSGLIVESLEIIPDSGVCLSIHGYRMEVLQTEENTVKLVKIYPK